MLKPTRKEAEAAITTLLHYLGENPEREGLIDTPTRVIDSYEEFFKGYKQNPEEILSVLFEEVDDYNNVIILKDIKFHSFCEHHLLPIVGSVTVGYWPKGKVVGISKLARIVEVYAKRLQIQERMTASIANTLNKVLEPKGVGVLIEATHYCLGARGINKVDNRMLTQHLIGCFKDDLSVKQQFLSLK